MSNNFFRNRIYSKIIIGTLVVSVLSLSGCKKGSFSDMSPNNQNSVEGYTVTSEGIYIDTEKISDVSVEDGYLIGHTGDKPDVSAPQGSISFEDAVKILDSCSFEKFYLPQKVSNYEKHYYETIRHNEDDCYMIGFYINKNGASIYLGTNALVSCDGKKVYKQSWMGSYEEVKIGSSENDKTFQELYPDAKITPDDALFVIESKGKAALELMENLTQYTFEIDTGLVEKNGVKCYAVYPKLNYEHRVKIFECIYVSADGENRVFIKDNESEDEYKEVL